MMSLENEITFGQLTTFLSGQIKQREPKKVDLFVLEDDTKTIVNTIVESDLEKANLYMEIALYDYDKIYYDTINQHYYVYLDFQYINLIPFLIEPIQSNPNDLVEIDSSSFDAVFNYGYYSLETNKLYIKNELSLDNIILFNSVYYNLEEIKNIPEKDIFYTTILGKEKKLSPFFKGPRNEKTYITFETNNKKGYIKLKPSIRKINEPFNKYYELTYYYSSSENANKFKFFETEEAIKIRFYEIEELIEFIKNVHYENETRAKLMEIIKQELIFGTDYIVLKIYNSITIDLLEHIRVSDVWNNFKNLITSISINNTGWEKETIISKMIIFLSSLEKEDAFLTKLLEYKINKKTLFYHLYENLNTEDFKQFIQITFEKWKKSSFIIPENKIYKNSETKEQQEAYPFKDGPILLPYKSNKTLGFYNSNVIINFHTEGEKILVSQKTEALNEEKATITNYYQYHVFHPIYITNLDKQKSEIQLDNIVPAFFIKANEDLTFWSNLIKGTELALDVVTTLSGIGNIVKFRHLLNIGKATSIIAKIQLTAGIIEITSGVTNSLLKLSDAINEPWGEKLSKYLFYLELLSLGTELTVAIKGGLRKSAKEVLEHTDELKKTAKNADEAKQIDEVIEHLEDVADISKLSKVAGRGRQFGQKLSKADFEEIRKFLKSNKVELEIHPLNQVKKIEGFFTASGQPALMPKGAAAIFITDGKKMKIILREEATVYEFFHEFIHFRHSKEIGLEEFYKLGGRDSLGELIKEQWVFDILMKNKQYLTKSEIDHALYYINNKVRNKFGKEPVDVDFDLSKIPEVRKEIKISEIFKIK